MSTVEQTLSVQPTGSYLLRVVTGSFSGSDEVIQIAEPIAGTRIDPRDQGKSGSQAWNITGSIVSAIINQIAITGSTVSSPAPVVVVGSYLTGSASPLGATGIMIVGPSGQLNPVFRPASVETATPGTSDPALVVRPVGTQTVTGTVSATQGTPAASVNAWPVKVTDGTNITSLINDGLNPTIYGLAIEGYIPSLAASTALQLSPDYTGNYGQIISGSVEQSKTSNPWTITGSISTPGVVDSGNSSTTILGTNGAFIGTGFDVTPFSATSITVFADQPSIINGLSFQWSSDNSNWDVTEASSVVANSGRGFSISPRGKFFRAVYTNGITAQSAFRLNVSHHVGGSGLISKALKATINTDNFAETTKAVVAGVDASNNVQLISAVNLPLIGNEYGIVARTINDYTPLINQNIQILGLLTTLNSKQYLLWGSSGYEGQQSGF